MQTPQSGDGAAPSRAKDVGANFRHGMNTGARAGNRRLYCSEFAFVRFSPICFEHP